jgi:cytochrome c-type biogenesis protein CcmH/NrfF
MRFQPKLISLLVLLLVPLLSAQTVTRGDPQSKQIREVGEQLKCQCESHCSYTVAGCNMLGCAFRIAVTSEIRADIDQGLSTSEIVDGLIAKYGLELRNSPPVEGFGLFGWAMPFAVLAGGLIAAPFVVKRWKRRQVAVVTPVSGDPELLSLYERRINEDLEDLD